MDAITSLSYQSLFVLWLSLVLGFAVLYFILEYFPGHGPEQLEGIDPFRRLFNTLYFSVITATSTGYGDITPQGLSKVLAGLQSISALFIFAVFVTKLVSHRQEIALRQIHKLTFEDMFHNIREEFFIVRKDFDRLMLHARAKRSLSDTDWHDLTVAYRQAQSSLRRIPDFYDDKNRLYTIDDRREELLQEGVQRTLVRIYEMIDAFNNKHIVWAEHGESLSELHELLNLSNQIIHFWRRQSPHHRLHDFEDLFSLIEQIKRHIDHSSPRSHG